MSLSTSFEPSGHRPVTVCSRLLLFVSLVTVLSALLQPRLVASQPVLTVTPSPAYFTDQPVIALPSTNTSTANVTTTFPYASALLLLLTNASSVYVTVPSIFNSLQYPPQLPSVTGAGFRAYLLTTFSNTCKRSDPTATGNCTLDITLVRAANQPTAYYSLYTLNLVTYSVAYTDTIPQHTWKYYVRYVQTADLTVGFDLASPGSGALTAAMWISAAQQLYTPGYPLVVNGSSAVDTGADQTCLLPGTEPDVPDYYIVGVYGFSATPAPSVLTLINNVNGFDSSSPFNGYAILSLLSLILAAGFIGVVLMRGCCMYRRMNGSWPGGGGGGGGGGASFTLHARAPSMMEPGLFQTTAGQAGVLRTDRAPQAATEAEIAALPSKTYVSTLSADGEECDDPRCSICLEEYVSGESRITTLRCAHSFHTACAGAWLRQRRHCPLCLQQIDQAHDVKQRRNSQPEVELADIRPTVVALPPTPSSVAEASRTQQRTEDGPSVLAMQRYSSAAQEEDADMCVVEIGTPHSVGRPPL